MPGQPRSGLAFASRNMGLVSANVERVRSITSRPHLIHAVQLVFGRAGMRMSTGAARKKGRSSGFRLYPGSLANANGDAVDLQI